MEKNNFNESKSLVVKDYKIKYLKYKNKYLELKKLLGGSSGKKGTEICTEYLKGRCNRMLTNCAKGIHTTREWIDNNQLQVCQSCARTPFCEKSGDCDSCVHDKQVIQTELDHAKIELSALEKRIIDAENLLNRKQQAKKQSLENKTRLNTQESKNEYEIIKKETAIIKANLEQLQTINSIP